MANEWSGDQILSKLNALTRSNHMASISHDGSGYRRLLFILGGKRSAIHLGKMSLKGATKVKDHVEAILEAKAVGHSLDAETAKWLRTRDDDLYTKLADKGLAPARSSAV